MIPFASLPVHSTLAAALVRRKYEAATPVQAAVLDVALAGRDMLVSSPTGSGKTVAFGTLIADTLLADAAAAPLAKARPPRALIVAPTRELAAQVCRELGWLFADAGVVLTAFTGGTDVGNDLRKLKAGVDIAVGTPGRLVDLHERKALDLSAIQVLVLDEADEMLDLGFKDDLEYLLGTAPKARRTLLFSATLPREIERMAATYQRDAVRVDPRPEGAKHAHADINYVAHLVRPQDRWAAVVNVLLAAGDARAIVFCRTREGVGALHQRLVDHGFKAAAIAGDRAQGERDRALQALRGGRVRVLVATNVAARGLDLPDVDLVVHADLPENADSLTHRSGRTGRAGKKGTSVVIADVVERRKAERLLAGTRTSVSWSAAPTANDVARAVGERLAGTIIEDAAAQASAGVMAEDDGMDALVEKLSAALPERALLSLLLRREMGRMPAPLPIQPVELHGAVDARRSQPWTRAVVFRINLGTEIKAEPRWLLPLICRRGGITRREIGSIRVAPQWSTFEIAAEAAQDFALSASRTDPRAPHVRIERLHAGGPRDARPGPAPGPRPAHPHPPRRRS